MVLLKKNNDKKESMLHNTTIIFKSEKKMQNDTYSVEETKYIKVGLYSLLFILVLMMLFYVPKRNVHALEESDSYDVFARFNRTDGLLVGDPVRMAGMNIGKVIDAQLDNGFKAILTLDIKKGINIPDDSSASIVSSSLIGGHKYIEIEPGGNDAYLEPQAEFEYTQDAMVLEELLDRIISIGKSNRQKGKETENE